jgi:uncharacterized membrane protein
MTTLQNKLVKLSIIVAALGSSLSLYLWYVHITTNIYFCTTTCESVITGDYGTFIGVPWGAWGFAFYLFSVVLQISRLKKWKCLLTVWFSWVNRALLYRGGLVIGWIITLYLRYLEIFILDEFCMYCWGSVLVMLILSILEYIVWKKDSK